MAKQELTGETIRELIGQAVKARSKAYAPYSKFQVGAALLTTEGEIVTGCNVENSAYSLANCAERTAIFTAVSRGITDFSAIAVVGSAEEFCSPCGACRQIMVEFAPEMQVYMAKPDGTYQVITAAELLPGYFKLNHKEA
ncbi:MAG TPA: cytidine deaminase [Bacillota bacterium]|nr:cytidine deaminase [Bacillota bacterium]